ncbi:MAG: DUF1016 family protein [Bacteroidales bacterium]|nr:DUF1016 family protein [Bacteroidales bacterium]
MNDLQLTEKEETKSLKALVGDVRAIIDNGLRKAYENVSKVMVYTYWQVGKRIVEEEQHGEKRAEYGKRLLNTLAEDLSKEYATGFSARDLRNYRQLYLNFNDLEIWYARVPNLTWTHYRSLLRVDDENARYWYLREASREMWSSRTLDRNIGSQYYYRLLQSPKKEAVVEEMKQLTAPLQADKLEFIKNPVVAEFLQLPVNTDFTESELEKAIIHHLKDFLLEMGRGFAFMHEQYHVSTDTGDYFIDLVFYNVILKCYFLIDLKTTTISHQDIGQMDMYIRMFDDMKRSEGDNPTIGLLLCADTGKDIARYSILNDSKQLFASKYLTFMPTEEELRREIERQKEVFILQSKKEDEEK